MSWVDSPITVRQPSDFTFVADLPDPGLDIAGNPIEPDKCYIDFCVESVCLNEARKFGKSFLGLLHGSVVISRLGGETVELAAVRTPTLLRGLDLSDLKRSVTLSERLLGVVPWRGGHLRLALGLLSARSEDLLSALIGFVTRVSEAAGVSFIRQAKPFLPLIGEGLSLIHRQPEGSVVEVGVHIEMDLRESQLCAIVAAPRGSLDPAKLSVDPRNRGLLFDDEPVQLPYCVFSIRRVDKRGDRSEVPEVKSQWEELRTAIISGDRAEAETALRAFERAVTASPDLIPTDATEVIGEAAEQVRTAFPRGFSPAGRRANSHIDVGLG